MQKKAKRSTEIQVLRKDFTSYKIRYKSLRKKSNTFTKELLRDCLIHGQINFIQFECSKIGNIFVWSNFKKNWRKVNLKNLNLKN